MKKSQHTWKRLLPACFLLAWTFFSCSDLSQEAGADGGKTAYICVKSARTSGQTPAERTLLPSPNPDDLTDLVLTGTKSGGTETELARADNLDELSSKRIEIPLGEWNFTLTAQLDGVEFSGSTRAKAVAGKTVSLTFDLTTSESKGGFTLQVFFSGEANEVLARIQSVSDGRYYNPLGQEITTTHDSTLTINEDDQGKKHVLLSAPIKLSGTECGFLDGSYKIQIDFNYKDGDTRCLLNTYETSVQIKAGYICKAVATLDLVGKYSVTLHFNGGSLDDFSPENDVLTGIFQRKKTVSLPGSEQMRKSGHTFAGWYDNEDLNGSAVTELAAGSQGSFDYWAKWEEKSGAGSVTLYVKDGGSGDGSSETSPLGSITDAVSKIAALVDSNEHSADENWNICLLSDIDDGQSVGSELNGKAARVTILSKSADDIKSIDYEVDDSNSKYVNLTIDTSVPIELKDINIVNNAYASGSGNNGGLLIKSGSVTMQSGEISGNTDCGVVICSGASFYMKGGSVKNNAYENLQGQVIYKEIENLGNFYMSGGTVGGDNGGTGVFVYNDGSITMSGNARIVPDYVVVLSSETVLTIGGSLTGTTPVATIAPYSYEPNRAWLSIDPDSETSLAAEYSKFAVAPKYDPDADEFINYVFDENGYVQPESSGVVTLYVKADGDDTNGDGSRAKPFASILGATKYIGDQADYSDPDNVPDSETDYIIKVIGELSGEQSLSWWEHDPITIKEAKSITIEGDTGLDVNGIPQDGFTDSASDECSLEIYTDDINVTLKNIKISGYKTGLCVGNAYNGPDDTFIYVANVILDSGVLITGVQCNHTDSKLGGGVTVKPLSKLYMKSGAKITGNTSYSSGGAVNINDDAYFHMQGGEISGNSLQSSSDTKGTGVYVAPDAHFTMSGDAKVASNNDVYLDENCVVTIGGTLTGTSPVATITPKIDATTSSYPTTAVIAVADDSGTSLPSEHSKFAVTPIYIEGAGITLNFELDAEGKIVAEGSGGGGGTSTSVTYYISPTGDNSKDGLSESNAIATVQHLVEDLMTDEDTDYIINVCGDMTSGSDSEWLLKNITGAKSITIQGNGDTNSGNKLPGVYTKSKAPITFKNIQIGAMYIDAAQIDEDSYAHANVILDSGTLIQNNGSITSIDDNGLYGVVHLFQKSAVTLTMKSGAVISNNTYVDEAAKQYGACGGVYIGQYSEFRMEGGTISGNAEYDVSNCQDGYFIVSGDAQAGKVYCKALDSADSRSAPIYIGGPLTSSTVATITPYFYPNWQALEIEKDNNDNPVTTTTIGDVYNKFAVTPYNSTNYEIDSNGKLQVSSSGSGIPQGFALVEGDTFSSDRDSHVGTIENVYDYTAEIITIPDLQVCSHLVTQAEYEKYMAYYGKVKEIDSVTPASTGSESTPATYVTWMDAIIYCNLRSLDEGLTPVYSLNGNTDITDESSAWVTWEKVAKDSQGKYYFNQQDINNVQDSTFDLDAEAFDYDLTANGYRLPTSAEYSYILTKNETLITGSYDEWCQNYYYDYHRIWFKASEQKPTTEEKYALSREANLGFRVVRNKQ